MLTNIWNLNFGVPYILAYKPTRVQADPLLGLPGCTLKVEKLRYKKYYQLVKVNRVKLWIENRVKIVYKYMLEASSS